MKCWFGNTFIEEVCCGWYYIYENNDISARSNLYDYVRGWTTYGH